MERALRAIDDLFTFRGNIAVRAQDIAYLASNPELESKVVRYRLQYLANSLMSVGLSGAKTWGAFNINEGNVGAEVYAGSRITEAAKAVIWQPVKYNWYQDIYEPARQAFHSIPSEIRAKLDEHLILGGIPENQAYEYAIPNIIHGGRNQMQAVDLLASMSLPLVNVIAAGEKVPWLGKLGIVSVAYLGLLWGYPMAKKVEKANFEWNVAQTTTKTGQENNGSGKSRWQVGKKWIKENLSWFGRHYQRERGLFSFGDVLSGIAVALRKGDAFGIVNMMDGAVGGFAGMYNTVSEIIDARRDARLIKLAREFCETSVYLPTEGSWDKFRAEKARFFISDLKEQEVCRFEDFHSIVADKKGTMINGSLKRGGLHLVEGGSGDGKTVFLFALRGMVESGGNVVFTSGSKLFSIYSLSQDELRHRVTYYSPDEAKAKGFRVVDMYTDEFLQSQADISEHKWVARAMSVDDALLERYLSGNVEVSWEKGIFDALDEKEKEMVVRLRQERIAFAKSRMHDLGSNMENVDPTRSLSELSSGMRERVMLDRVLLALDKGTEVLVLDEPLGRVDPDTARHLIREICQRLEKIPAERRPAIVLVSNVHKNEIREEAEKILGSEKISTLDVHKN